MTRYLFPPSSSYGHSRSHAAILTSLSPSICRPSARALLDLRALREPAGVPRVRPYRTPLPLRRRTPPSPPPCSTSLSPILRERLRLTPSHSWGFDRPIRHACSHTKAPALTSFSAKHKDSLEKSVPPLRLASTRPKPKGGEDIADAPSFAHGLLGSGSTTRRSFRSPSPARRRCMMTTPLSLHRPSARQPPSARSNETLYPPPVVLTHWPQHVASPVNRWGRRENPRCRPSAESEREREERREGRKGRMCYQTG